MTPASCHSHHNDFLIFPAPIVSSLLDRLLRLPLVLLSQLLLYKRGKMFHKLSFSWSNPTFLFLSCKGDSQSLLCCKLSPSAKDSISPTSALIEVPERSIILTVSSQSSDSSFSFSFSLFARAPKGVCGTKRIDTGVFLSFTSEDFFFVG